MNDFEQEFPSLEDYAYIAEYERPIKWPDGTIECPKVVTIWAVQEHCLDKQRVREALLKYEQRCWERHGDTLRSKEMIQLFEELGL